MTIYVQKIDVVKANIEWLSVFAKEYFTDYHYLDLIPGCVFSFILNDFCMCQCLCVQVVYM